MDISGLIGASLGAPASAAAFGSNAIGSTGLTDSVGDLVPYESLDLDALNAGWGLVLGN